VEVAGDVAHLGAGPHLLKRQLEERAEQPPIIVVAVGELRRLADDIEETCLALARGA
jgi:hypothetical protein